MVALVLLGLIVAAGIAAVCGWLPDTRDPEFGLGRILRGRERPPTPPSGR